MTLSFKYKTKVYTSKEFDWKAMCLVNEGHNDESKKGVFSMCDAAVNYLFEDTDGAAVLDSIPLGARGKLCSDAWEIYIKEITAKND